MLSPRVAVRALCLATAFVVGPDAVRCLEAAPSPNPHLGARVRGVTRQMNTLIEQGTRRSPTFRSLVAALNNSDVIVFLETTNRLPSGLDGRLTFLTSAGGVRYLHAQVTASLDFDDLIAVAGHELQHAVEVATHDEVRDAASLGTLYERIGIRSHVKNSYDTTAAQLTGKRVRAELS